MLTRIDIARLGAGCAAAVLGLAIAAAAAPTARAAAKSCHPDGKPVEDEVIFNSSGGTYGENLEKAFFHGFTAECGVKVVQVTDARSYAQMRQYVRSGNAPWDMGGTRIDQEYPLGVRDGLFHELPADFWDGIKDQMVSGSYTRYGAWATPYSDVLVYSTKAVSGGMHGWADFWDVKRFPGARIMQNSPASLVMALMADGVAPDKIYPLDLDRAFKKMDQLRPDIRAFWTSADQPVQGVANGEFVAGTTLNGRAANAMRQGKPIGVSWNGALLRSAWNFILKGAPHPRAAEALLYYMQRAEGQAELARLSGYTGGNKNVGKLLDPSVAANLAGSPEHIAEASVVDAQWWADNNQAVQARWDAWMAGR